MKTFFDSKALIISCVVLFGCNALGNNEGSTEESYLQFPSTLTPKTPYDVNVELEKALLKENKIPEAQRMFDILSWQLFISLNWPLDAKGNPMPSITDPGNRSWESWKESFEVFKTDGSAPSAWGIPEQRPHYLSKVANTKEKVLFRTSKFAPFHGHHKHDVANEINQAFTAPIWDQNGNIVRYEIRLNKVMTDYITNNQLYNLDGQIAFSKAGKKVKFPEGSRDKQGTLEVKIAWKVMDPQKDIMDRYFTTDALVLNEDGSFTKKKVGMVGMHISTKTKSSPQWVWATFEHVDNLETNLLHKKNGKRITPSFYDPECAICPVNTLPDTTAKLIKNQIQRVLPIDKSTQELNNQVQKLLAQKGSYWQYYMLIGTQWPTDPSAAPYISTNTDTSVYTLPDAVTNKSGGKPVPVYLTNMIMETYFQGGTIINDSVIAYNKYLGNEPAYFQIQGFPTNDIANTQKLIFGTESCVGCHFSSSIAIKDTIIKGKRTAIFGNPGQGDFDWLMQLKANFKSVPQKSGVNN